VLFITDDYDDLKEEMVRQISPGEYFHHEGDNYLEFEITIIEDIAGFSGKYDAVLIDYGLTWEREDILTKIFLSGAKMAWVGGLGGDYYNRDARRMFPDALFLHHLLTSDGISADNVLEVLYRLFERDCKPEPKEDE
jgi:hypothetical protein